MKRAQISEELGLGMAEIAARVDDLRGRYNPEFEDILGARQPDG